MARSSVGILLLGSFALLALSGTAEARAIAKVGPIQKVLELLDELKAKIIAEGEVEGEQFEEYNRWCAEEADAKEDAIKFGTDRVAELNAELEQLNGEVATLGTDIEKTAGDIAVNDKDLKAATEIREKEKADFDAADKELSDTIDMIIRAKSVLKKQLNLGLAQTGKGQQQQEPASGDQPLANDLQKVVNGLSTILDAAFVDAKSRKALSAFLATTANAQEDEDDMDLQPAGAPKPEAYKSHSAGILDVLDELKDKAEEEQGELRKKEMNANHAYEMLKQSLTDDINVQTARLNQLKSSSASKKEAIGVASGDLATATKTLAEDKAYFENLNMMCMQKSSDWEARQKSRAEELQALEEAKKVLSGDAASGAFERRASMVQLAVHTKDDDEAKAKTAAYLEAQGRRLGSLGLSQLAARVRSGDDPFAKVKGMIQQMIERLIKEEAEEADHKAWCDEETGKSKKARAKHQDRVDVLTGRIDKAEAAVGTLTQDIAALQKEVAEMNAAEAEATEIRNKEKAEYEAAIKDYAEAMDALSQAISVLTEYYGGKEAALLQTRKKEPEFGGPVFEGEYKKQDGSGIIGLLEVAQSDFSKMDSEAKAEEQQAAREYKTLVQDNEVSRATKEQDIKGKTAEKGRLETSLAEMHDDRTSSQKELDAVLEYLEKLKGACEVKPESYEERKRRRRAEIDSLREALNILSGEELAAGASAFLQVRRHTAA